MKLFGKGAIALFLLTACLLEGKDLEIRGTTFPISEENLADFLLRSIQGMPPEEFARRQEEAKLHLVWRAKNPPPAPNISEAVEYRSFLFDPSYVAQEEIKNAEGEIVIRRGAKVNPLEGMALSSGLLFFDGGNKQHVKWAKAQMGNFKWVLVKGIPTALEQEEQRPVYFDQRGRYISYFQIKRVPARVSQEGFLLLVEETPARKGLQGPPAQKPKKETSRSSKDEISEFIAMAMQNADPDALTIGAKGKNTSPAIIAEAEATEKKCNTKAKVPSEAAPANEPRLFIFISFSVPLESWKDLSCELEKAGGVFVLNGIPNNSFLEFAARVEELRNKGVDAPIQIDPQSFKKYGIDQVPAIVLDDGHAFDKIYGNISLSRALSLIAESGTVCGLSRKILSGINGGELEKRERF